jgi:hypothetical protein
VACRSAASRRGTTDRLIQRQVSAEKKTSTTLSYEPAVGVKWSAQGMYLPLEHLPILMATVLVEDHGDWRTSSAVNGPAHKHAFVLSVDEKPHIQALDGAQPGLPLRPGKAGGMSHS